MLTMLVLSTLLMLRGLGGAAASDLQVYGKASYSDKTSLSSNDGRHAVKKQPHQQGNGADKRQQILTFEEMKPTKSGIRRSLDLESFNVHVTPTTSKISLPTIIKLYPPTAKPLHLHANMPMRFGRESNPDDDRAPNSIPNMPQRFGRSWEMIQMCTECFGGRETLKPPQKLGRNSLYWSLLRTLANAQLVNTGLHWAEDFGLTTSSEEMQMQEKTLT